MVHTTDSGFPLCFSSVLTDFWWKWDTEFHCAGLLLPLTERERTGQNAKQPSFPLPNLSLLNGSSGSENNESYCQKKISANQLQPAPPLHDVPALLSSETQISTKFYWQHPAKKARQAWSLWARQEWWAAYLVQSTPPCERFEALPMHAVLRTERTASCSALVRSPCRVIETLFYCFYLEGEGEETFIIGLERRVPNYDAWLECWARIREVVPKCFQAFWRKIHVSRSFLCIHLSMLQLLWHLCKIHGR